MAYYGRPCCPFFCCRPICCRRPFIRRPYGFYGYPYGAYRGFSAGILTGLFFGLF